MQSKKITRTLTFNEVRFLPKDHPMHLAYSCPFYLPFSQFLLLPSLSLGSVPDVLRLLCSTRVSRKEMPHSHVHCFGKFPPYKAQTQLCTITEGPVDMRYEGPVTRSLARMILYSIILKNLWLFYCKLKKDKFSLTWLQTTGHKLNSILSVTDAVLHIRSLDRTPGSPLILAQSFPYR